MFNGVGFKTGLLFFFFLLLSASEPEEVEFWLIVKDIVGQIQRARHLST